MLSSNKMEEMKNYSQEKYWERLRQLNQATQRTGEEETELTLLREDLFPRNRQRLLDEHNADDLTSSKNDLEEMDELRDEIGPKFEELDKVRLKVATGGMYGATIPAGSEGFVMDVLSPDFERYRKTKSLLYRYEVKIEIWDLETFQIIVHDRVTVDEDEIEGIDMLTIDKEYREYLEGEGKLPDN